MTWKQLRGYAAGAVAFVTCPCHLPVVWPVLLALTAGTAFGAWLSHNLLLVAALMTATFIGGLALAWRWLWSNRQGDACVPQNLEQKVTTQAGVASCIRDVCNVILRSEATKNLVIATT
ncbi:MAG: hypothetical protein D6796_00135, partial [Caldilineae bacterium]